MEEELNHMPVNGPTQHLTWKELGCKDGTPYPNIWRTNRAIELAEVFELIRAACGHKPIQILSAFRTSDYNKRIGGARNSQHIQGRALDLRPPDGYTIDEFYKIIKQMTAVTSIGGIGKYKTFVHVDIRPKINDKVAYWFGTGMKDDRV